MPNCSFSYCFFVFVLYLCVEPTFRQHNKAHYRISHEVLPRRGRMVPYEFDLKLGPEPAPAPVGPKKAGSSSGSATLLTVYWSNRRGVQLIGHFLDLIYHSTPLGFCSVPGTYIVSLGQYGTRTYLPIICVNFNPLSFGWTLLKLVGIENFTKYRTELLKVLTITICDFC